MSARISDLVKWAVYRTLDTRTGAIYDHSGLFASERLSRWQHIAISDADMLTEITSIYAYNPSMRSPSEPYLCVKSDYALKSKSCDRKYPALWVSLTNPEMMLRLKRNGDYDFNKPDLVGIDIVRVVRHLMSTGDVPVPPIQGQLL